MESLEQESVRIRGLLPSDLDRVIRVDERITGRPRGEYFRLKLDQNLAETGVKVSLAAEVDRIFAGFLLARVYYGEFGMPEPVAVLDTIGVDPDFRGQGVGEGLMKQLGMQLVGLRVSRLQTEVDWDQSELLVFFKKTGFRPAPRLCLDLEVQAAP